MNAYYMASSVLSALHKFSYCPHKYSWVKYYFYSYFTVEKIRFGEVKKCLKIASLINY